MLTMNFGKMKIMHCRQQSIKIIAETVVNMNIVARKNISSKLKNSASEIGYYSYTNRCTQLKNRTQI